MPFQTITAKAAHDEVVKGDGACVLLDVREPFEVAMASVPGSLLIPMRQIPGRLAEIDRSKRVLVLCHTGCGASRSRTSSVRSGYANVANVRGGIDSWSETVDASIPRY